MEYQDLKEEFTHSHAKLYADNYDKGRAEAESRVEQYEKLVVKRHYQSIARATNKKKGFGTNRKLAKELANKRWNKGAK